MLFFATTINYLDRQVLSLTWKDFIAPEFHWTNNDYGNITALFSIFYALSMLFAGRLVDRLGTKKGFIWAIGIWSFGACLHAFCGIITSGWITGIWQFSFQASKASLKTVGDTGLVVSVSVTLFILSRWVLALGEAGNFPAAIKATAEYFPKKDRAFATSIFNSGATIGALVAPVSIPFIAEAYGWEMAFVSIGLLGFVWMLFWHLMYEKPEKNGNITKEELAYIQQDEKEINGSPDQNAEHARLFSIGDCFQYRQTWAFIMGKLLTDGVWWFFLFWTPAYLSSVYKMEAAAAAFPLFVLYLITLLSILGGWLPTYFVEKKGMNPYEGRMKAMLIFAFFPVLALFAQPLGHFTYWIPVGIIGISGAAHQAWSANIFTTVGDMFPKHAIGTITGIGGLAGGIGATIINKGSGLLFDYTEEKQLVLFGFKGIEAGYFIIFSLCSVAYLLGWGIMKLLVPKYEPIVC
ncbi:MFS transporter [Flavobacterium sp. TSSA_36]|uniref:MFS transporter n=1 Tax=Flavobacterium sp. TSSA_36 TaxID=3447669 RepID=UPI003F373AB7